MKTTIELENQLFERAKVTAAQRRTSLKALFTQALRKELQEDEDGGSRQGFVIDEEGFPVLRSGNIRVTTKDVRRLDEETE